jgi:Zn-dependent protease with chaperone function
MSDPPSPPFSALLFSVDLPPAGVRATVEISPDAFLLILPDLSSRAAPYLSMQISLGGFDHDQIRFDWPGGSFTLIDPDARSTFLSHVPGPLVTQVRRLLGEQSAVERRRRLGWAVIAAIFLVPMIALWMGSDRITGWVVDQIPIETERRLGGLIYEQTQTKQKPVPELETVVAELGNRLTKGSPYTFEWHVVQDSQVNAFAVPGGHVVVFTGLILAAESPEELAGVLAHEVQHVLLRHSLRAMVHDIGWQATLSLLLGNWGGGTIETLAHQLGGLKFGRDQERQADVQGLALLKREAINPNGMITFFEKLARKNGAAPPALLSTHPASDDRAKIIREEIQKIGPWPSHPLPYSWKEVRAKAASATNR